MAKKRVHEIAKAHDLSSKEVLAALKAAGVDAKVAASNVDEDAAAKAISAARGNGAKIGTPDSKSPAQAAAPKQPAAEPAAVKPAAAAAGAPKAAAPAAKAPASTKPVRPAGTPQQGGAPVAPKNAAS